MSGEDADERMVNALKQSLEYIDLFLERNRSGFKMIIQAKLTSLEFDD